MTDLDINGQSVATTGVTIADVKEELERRKFPSILTTDDYVGILNAALRELNRYSPMSKFVGFTTVTNIQDYYIFDPANATTLGVAAGALDVVDVWWSPGGDWSSLNIYSPGWIMLAQMVVFTGSFFHQPSQMMTLRQKLDSWKTQFGSQGFDVIGPVGAATSILRLYPVPKSEANVIVECRMPYTLVDIIDSVNDIFMQWVEYYTSDALANLYATTAGVDLLNFADSKEAMKYWEGKAQRYYTRALNSQAGMQGQVMRG
jgi:hypothetical protein